MNHAFSEVPEPYFLVVPGAYSQRTMRNRVIYLPMNSNIPLSDLVNSASCVVGKAGYGTVSECWGMNTPLGVYLEDPSGNLTFFVIFVKKI